ncbi:hypothetical protein ABKN59_000156 [Abortiporus biennis]
MKTLRKSLNGHKEQVHISTPVSALPTLSKPASAIQPPKKVIRALASHRSTSPQELSFEKGDFFHVINDNDNGQWYEAHNPMTGSRGLVPCSMFEVFGKGAAVSRAAPPISTTSVPPVPSQTSPKRQAFFAVVKYDFEAERTDELDAKAGDAISVVAQSNRQWFVAKHIGRLGRPGLIPADFIEIRDPATGEPIEDVGTLIDSGALPKAEEWLRAVVNYKANSISLGVLEDSKIHSNVPLDASGRVSLSSNPSNLPEAAMQHHQYTQQLPLEPPSLPKPMPKGILLSADVKSFHFEMDEFWFRVHAIFQPYPNSDVDPLPQAKQLVLFRSYNDFYDFQVDLLDSFPQEAGRMNGDRLLPYMPGPAEHVDNEITISRRQELDEYLHQLCQLKSNAKYILEHQLVREFLATKPGDAEQDVEPRVAEMAALSRSSYAGTGGHTEVADINARLTQLSVHDAESDASDYEDDADANGPYGVERIAHPYASPEVLPKSSHYMHNRTESSSSLHKQSLRITSTHSRSSSRTSSPMPSPYGPSRSSVMSSQEASLRSSQAPSVATSASGRSRSQSNAALNAPSISASNPQTAFVKIKIYDQATEDLVAIRVHPRVTHSQLLDKVGVRLGKNVAQLRYRDSLSNEMVGLDGDDDLRYWIDRTERLVLYADS